MERITPDNLEHKNRLIDSIKEVLSKHWNRFWKTYGILGVIALAAVLAKLWFFYVLMGVSSNFVLVWVTTCILIFLLFTSTKNKWGPAVFYLLVSVLMFADTAYSSFFNRYLSVNMMGAAGFLGDVTGSIKEVLRPKFFLMFADSLLIFAALAGAKLSGRKK